MCAPDASQAAFFRLTLSRCWPPQPRLNLQQGKLVRFGDAIILLPIHDQIAMALNPSKPQQPMKQCAFSPI